MENTSLTMHLIASANFLHRDPTPRTGLAHLHYHLLTGLGDFRLWMECFIILAGIVGVPRHLMLEARLVSAFSASDHLIAAVLKASMAAALGQAPAPTFIRRLEGLADHFFYFFD
jgi:hypothetical protein